MKYSSSSSCSEACRRAPFLVNDGSSSSENPYSFLSLPFRFSCSLSLNDLYLSLSFLIRSVSTSGERDRLRDELELPAPPIPLRALPNNLFPRASDFGLLEVSPISPSFACAARACSRRRAVLWPSTLRMTLARKRLLGRGALGSGLVVKLVASYGWNPRQWDSRFARRRFPAQQTAQP